MALGEKQAVAIVAAAGSGRRMGPGRPKLLREIEGKPVLVRTLEALDLPELEAVFLLLHPEEKGQVLPVLENQLRTYGYKHQLVIIDGGKKAGFGPGRPEGGGPVGRLACPGGGPAGPDP